MIEDVSLNLSAKGKVSLSERGEKKETYGWWSSEFVDADSDDINLNVSMDVDDPLSIKLSAYHVSAKDGVRVFHAIVEIFPDQRDLELLHSFLGFLIADNERLSSTMKPE